MSKATDIAARAAKLSERRGGREMTGDATSPTANQVKSAPRAKPVRVTTDLAPQSYRQLVAYCGELAETFGRAKVPHAEVIRALVAQLEADPALRLAIADAVQARMSK